MTLTRRLLLCVAMVQLGVGLCMAQDAAKPSVPAANKTTQKKKDGHMGTSTMMAPQLSPEMKKLSDMLMGRWTAEVHSEAMMGMPASDSKGTATYHAGPGGMSLVQDFRSSGTMGKFHGMGVVWFDAAAKVYKGLWCDSMSPRGCEDGGTGNWQGDDLVVTAEMDMMGKKMTMRDTYTDIKPDSFTFKMESSEDGGAMKPTMTIHYKRASAAAPAMGDKSADTKKK